MQLHELKPIHKLKKKKRVGRGGKKGTYSGRGMKGQKSRSGTNYEPIVRGMIKKYPKLKGYRFSARPNKAAVVNLGILEKVFNENDSVNPQILLEKRLISRAKGKVPAVKILGQGKLTKALHIENCQLSEAAEKSVTEVKGTVKSEKQQSESKTLSPKK